MRQPSILSITKLHGGRCRITFDRFDSEPRINPFLPTCDVAVSADVIEHFCSKLVAVIGCANRTGNPLEEDALSAPGIGLFDAFLPKGDVRAAAIRRELRSLPPGSPLLIAADDPEICWELMKHEPGGEFLGSAFDLGRRLTFGDQVICPATSGSEQCRALIIANSTGDLPEAAKEAQILKESLERRGVSCDFLESAHASLGKLLDYISGGYDIIHYAGHVRFDEETREYVLVLYQEKIFTASTIRSHLRGTPLVFLNGCESSRGVEGLTAAFLSAGARAVVGSLFRVPDAGARAFAESFYETALGNMRPIGEAMRAARAALRARPAFGGAWASFILYGDPCLTVRIEGDELPDLLAQVQLTGRDCAPSCRRVLARALEYGRPAGVLGTAQLFAAMVAGEDPSLRDSLLAQGIKPQKLEKAFAKAFRKSQGEKSEPAGHPAAVGLSKAARRILSSAREMAAGEHRSVSELDILNSFVEQGGGHTGGILKELGISMEVLSPGRSELHPLLEEPALTRIGPLDDGDCTSEAWVILLAGSRLASRPTGVYITSLDLFRSLLDDPAGPAAAAFRRLGFQTPTTAVDSPTSRVVHPHRGVHCSQNTSRILLLAQANAASAGRLVSSTDLLTAFIQQGGGHTGADLRKQGFVLASLTSQLFEEDGVVDWTRFDSLGASVLQQAVEFADQLAHGVVGRVHLLYAMLRVGNLLIQRLRGQGADPGMLAELLYVELPRGTASGLADGPLKLTSLSVSMVEVLCSAEAAARQTQDGLIREEHLLEAWVVSGGGTAGSFLVRSGVKVTELL